MAALIVAAAALVYLLYPVQRRVEGAGILRPRFEQSALIRVPIQGAMVTRVNVEYLQRVDTSAPLFNYLEQRRWAVEMIASKTAREEPRPPNPIEERRVAQQRASNAWCAQALAAHGPDWEHRLCIDWGHRLYARSQIELHEQGMQANQQAGREALNAVYTFDQAAGQYVPTTEGQPFPSPFVGTVVALWIAPRMQASPTIPALEIMVDDTPLEVLGLVPAAQRGRLAAGTVEGTVRPHETPIATRISAVTGVELGAATLEPSDIAMLFPGVPASGPSVVARVALKAKADPTDIGRIVRFELGGSRRPRIWTWIADR